MEMTDRYSVKYSRHTVLRKLSLEIKDLNNFFKQFLSSTRLSARSQAWVITTPCSGTKAWRTVTRKLPGRKGPGAAGQQLVEQEPAACLGGQEGQ